MTNNAVLISLVVGMFIVMASTIIPALALSALDQGNDVNIAVQPDAHDPRDCADLISSSLPTQEIADVCHFG